MNGGLVIQLAFDCAAATSLYALVALAAALAYSGSGVYHLAIGQVAIAGALVAANGVQSGWPVWLAVVVGVAIAAALSAGAERSLVATSIGRPLLAAVLLLAGAVVLREVLEGAFPRTAYAFPSPSATYRVLGGFVHASDLLTIAVVLAAAVAGAAVIRMTTLGAALRLTANAPGAAELIGVDTARMRMLSFGVGGSLAAVAMLLAAPRFPLAATGGVVLALRGIAAAAAGDMRSPAGIVGAAALIAVAQVIAGFFLGSGGEAIANATAVLLIAARFGARLLR
jgi:branched-subunit amino acid ABC-type transport system permease component